MASATPVPETSGIMGDIQLLFFKATVGGGGGFILLHSTPGAEEDKARERIPEPSVGCLSVHAL